MLARTAAKKSFKCSLIQRSAIILAMLLLCAVFCQAQYVLGTDTLMTLKMVGNDFPALKKTPDGRDTVQVLILVCDTSYNAKLIPNGVFFIKAFSIRKIEYRYVDVSVDPNTTTYLPGGGAMTTLLGWVPRYEERQFYTHLEYLDDKKLPLSKNIIVWQIVSK